MHFDLGGDIHIDHCLEALNVQPASRDVGGNQNTAAAVGKLNQNLVAFALFKIAMKLERDNALSA